MQPAGGRLLPPVQKLVATIIFAQRKCKRIPPLRKINLLLFLRQLDNFHGFFLDGGVVFPFMGAQAAGTVLDAVFQVCKIAAAFVA